MCGSYLRDDPFVRQESYSLSTVPNVNQQTKKAVVIVLANRADDVPVPRWKKAGSVCVFPARDAKPRGHAGLARMVSVAKAVLRWLRTGEMKRHSVPESFPSRRAGQPGTRTVGH
jgi:hypothetical protein